MPNESGFIAKMYLCGGFRIAHCDGEDLTPRSRKTRCLMALLALSDGGTVSREKLAGLLWSRSAEEQARGSLRQSCKELRRLFKKCGQDTLNIDYQSISINRTRVWIDVLEIERYARSHEPINQLRAVELWRGDLLAGISSHDPVFDAWLEGERTCRREHLCRQLEQALRAALATNSHLEALALGQALVEIEPNHEPAHCALMRIYASQGDSAAALRQYRSLEQGLARELDAMPGPQARELLAAIQTIDHEKEAVVAPAACVNNSRDGVAVARCPTTSRYPRIVCRSFVSRGQDSTIDTLTADLSDDIAAALTRHRELVVIADLPGYDCATLYKDFGIDYLLLGTLRPLCERTMRLTATLVSCDNHQQVWAEQRDCTIPEFVNGHDEWVAGIVAKLHFALACDRLQRGRNRSAAHRDAYDYWLRSSQLSRQWCDDADRESVALLTDAIAIDPGFARAYSSLAAIHNTRSIVAPGNPNDKQDRQQAFRLVEQAVALDPLDSQNQIHMAWSLLIARDYENATYHFHQARVLNPYDPQALMSCAQGLAYLGRSALSVQLANRAIKLHPEPPQYYYAYLASIYFLAGFYEKTVEVVRKAPALLPDVNAWLAAALAMCGSVEEAHDAADAFVRDVDRRWVGEATPTPEQAVHWLVQVTPLSDTDGQERVLSGLRQAGLPVSPRPVQ